jgi:hypothetical protein
VPLWQIHLDTAAPVITWGAVSDAIASEELTMAYTLDEPAVTAAELRLIDGRVLPMVVEPTRLRIVIPDDAQEQDATVRVYLRDAVDNSATVNRVVRVIGTVGPTPPPPPSAPPIGPRAPSAPARVIRTAPSRARGRSSYASTAVVVSASRLYVWTVYNGPEQNWWWTWGEARVSSTTTVRAAVSTSETGKLGARMIVRRRDAPSTEDEMIFLDLL